MAAARTGVRYLKARAAAGRRERLIVFADQRFVVEAVVVGIEPELRGLVRRAAASIPVEWRGHPPVGIPSPGGIHHPPPPAGLQAAIRHRHKPPPAPPNRPPHPPPPLPP